VSDLDRLRARLAANGAAVPDAMLPIIGLMAGPMLEALDALAAADLGDLEPFDPTRVLVADARARGLD
jgi:hypothetical protein